MVLSLLILGALMIMFGEAPSWLGGSEWKLRITGFTELSGITEGTSVTFLGVEIGRVSAIEFVDPEIPGIGVEVVALIKNNYSVPVNARAKIYAATLGLGQGRVDIIAEGEVSQMLPKDGTARPIPGTMHSMLRDIVPEDLTDNFAKMVENFANVAEAAEPLIDDLRTVVEARRVADVEASEGSLQPNLSTVIERIDRLATSINEVVDDREMRDGLRGITNNLVEASDNLNEWSQQLKAETERTSATINDTLGRTEEQVSHFLVNANTVLESLDQAAKSLHAILQAVEGGQGTAGLAVRDPRLYEAATLTFERLSEAVKTAQLILNKIEEEGRFTIAQDTALGTFEKDFPTPAAKKK